MLWLLACATSSQIDQVPNLGRVSARHIEEARGIILDGGIPQRDRWTAEGVLAGGVVGRAESPTARDVARQEIRDQQRDNGDRRNRDHHKPRV